MNTLVHGDTLRGVHTVAAAETGDLALSTQPPTPIANRRNVMLSPRTSGSAATGTVAIVLGTYDDGIWAPKAYVQATFTASALVTIGGLYAAPSIELPTGGWPYVKFVQPVISTGTAIIEWSVY